MHDEMAKAEAYSKLVLERRRCNACAGSLVNPANVLDGALDSGEIGPYSRWQGNLDASLVIVGQDFADLGSFLELGGWPGESVRTNLRLVELLGAVGIKARLPRPGVPDDAVFATNAVLCLKPGGRSDPIPASCYRACGERFLRPTLELVRPKAVATLGQGALSATLYAFGIAERQTLKALLDEGATVGLPGGMRLFPMWHPAARIPLAQQRRSWARLGRWLQARPGVKTQIGGERSSR